MGQDPETGQEGESSKRAVKGDKAEEDEHAVGWKVKAFESTVSSF